MGRNKATWVLVCILFLLAGCASEGRSGEAGETISEGAGGPDTTSEARDEATVEQASRPDAEPAIRKDEPRQAGREAALVPIVHLTSPKKETNVESLSRTGNLAVAREDRGAAEAVLDGPDLAPFDSPAGVVEHVSQSPEAVGLVPWDEVGPRVKTLPVDGVDILEPGASDSGGYPLRSGRAEVPDPGRLLRVVVAGDVVLDRGQNYTVIQQGLGLNFPLDGGYAAITGRTAEPSPYSEYGVIHQFVAERRGGTGAVREYLSAADLTLANLESPVVRGAVWHPDATTFTGDPRLLPVLEQAGIDGVTLGNNHILDAGAAGLRETLAYLQDAGIRTTGAGMNLQAAREPLVFELGDTTVGVLNHQGVPSYEWAWATETYPGTAPLQKKILIEDIRRLRPRVDFLIFMPHWGNEYLATPEPGQVELARAAVDAGVDLIVGGHAHWTKGMEVYEGKPIFYGTGNFLFDQSWSEETSTGVFAEIILYEGRIIQARPVPFIILDKAQPNFLLPKAGGNRALKSIYAASLGPEFEAYKETRGPRTAGGS